MDKNGRLDFGQRDIFTVSEIVSHLRFLVEKEFRDVWICGEVTNLQVSRSGHCYFTLKDSETQIRAVCFKMKYQYLRFKPEEGMEIRIRGVVSIYSARGDLQVIVGVVEPAGKGALQVAFEQLKERLKKEGLFDERLKQRIPLFPHRIGLVTSTSGAALHDILRVLKRRNDGLDLLIAPVQVQGKTAAIEIAQAIKELNQQNDIDVLILARGGGSIEDLWAFNEEIVAREIFNSKIPVISAIGHETDFTISDLVADVRAPTPSVAAEIVSAARQELVQRHDDLVRRLTTSSYLLIERKRGQLQKLLSSPYLMSPSQRVHLWSGEVSAINSRLQRSLPSHLPMLKKKLDQLEQTLCLRAEFYLYALGKVIEGINQQLEAYSPLSVLHRGYAIVSDLGGKIVRNPEGVFKGERLNIRLERGEFTVFKD